MALKTEPRYGYFPWWPEEGDEWIHPEDVDVARAVIPSSRVWRRDGTRGPFAVLHYGELRLRIRPVMWVEVAGEGLDVGEWVEVLSRMQKNTHYIGVIREMVWDSYSHSIRYQVQRGELVPPRQYQKADLRRIEALPSEPIASLDSR